MEHPVYKYNKGGCLEITILFAQKQVTPTFVCLFTKFDWNATGFVIYEEENGGSEN